MLRTIQFFCFVCVLSFVSGLVNSSFADFEEKLKDAGEINDADDPIPIIDNIIDSDPMFPTREGPEWTQEFGDLRWAPNFIFGPRQFEKMRDLPRDSEDYQLGTKVAFFRVRGSFVCTGFLVGPDLVMTNAHCLPSDISRIEIYMAYYQEPSVDRTRGGVHARVTEVLRSSRRLDYALLRLDTPIGNTFGWLTLDTTVNPEPGQSVKLIHHSAGRSKEISRQDSEIVALNDPRPYLLAYYADTEGGTSGCPVFMRDGTNVIAINWGGLYRDINRNREYDPGIDVPICNAGNLMSYIVPEIRQWLPTVPPPIIPPQPPTPVSDDQMYWTDAGTSKIQRANPNGTNVEDLITIRLQRPWGIAVDAQRGKMYWTDAGTDKIQRANLNGTNVEDLVTTGVQSPWGIAVDAQRGKMYWTDAGTSKIQRANLDGTNVEIIISSLNFPDGIALDLQARKMYWTDFGSDKIQRANLDGTNVEDLVNGISSYGIALDLQARKMYWTNAPRDKIQRANLDGTYIQDLVTTGLSAPEDIVLDVQNNKMYWTDWGTDKIQRANLDGTNVQDLIAIGLEYPVGIALKTSQVLSPLTFNPSTIPNQTFNVGIAVSLTLPTATGGTPPYSYSLSPSPPPGLYFDPIGSGPGYIGGRPTTVTPINTYTYSARDGVGASGSLTFTITVIGNELDVNGDGVVDVADLVLVAMAYGRRVSAGTDLPEDVNSDGVVNLIDLTLVAQAIDAASGANAPSISDIEGVAAAANALSGGNLAYRNVAAALADAKLEKGIPETLLKALQYLLIEMEMAEIPESTALLPNYPNPFNPETWIPYHLAQDAEVILTIHDVSGNAVRSLTLGHQAAGVYESRGRAAYWDGRNQHGEKVASGLYFYTLTAGDFTATRKLLIAK